MKRNTLGILSLLVVLFFGSRLSAQETSALADAVQALRADKDLSHATVSVSVYNLTRGKMVYESEGQRSVTPASLVKLFTTATAFDKLGAQFRFKTVVGYSGSIDKQGTLHGNVYIIGGGDPLLGSYRYRQTSPDSLFHTWKQALASHGIRAVDGRICFDAGIFDNQALPDSWQWGDIGNYYASGVSGLNFHENMFFVYFNAGRKVGYPAAIASTQPKKLTVRLQNEVLTGSEGSGDRVCIYGDPAGSLRLCTGTVPQGKSNFGVRASLPHPAECCAEQFAVYLRNNDVNVTNSVTEVFSRPDDLKTVLDYFSSPYYVIAQYTNMTSNNMYAECIYKYLGYLRNGKGSYAGGAQAVNDYLRSRGFDLSGVRLVDGSGLSRINRVNTNFVCRFLADISKTAYFDDFLTTLGKVGESGTVRHMLADRPAGVDIRMKSGSMEDVRAYAGYVTTLSGERLSFCVVSNNFDCTPTQMRQKLERVLLEISRL
ncbi:MAG: D-alanyl-D-alanine carboxypeptidase/D-alanyl-D-alanine-endopeptidase [Bacteroidales bacterium]|nr:D-alanyl-D-alanine carboxypeptidase/D-alanyl-D-alanine-endopeptidase [Bacteroidales bacterium]